MEHIVTQSQAISISIVDLLITLALCFAIGLWQVFIYRVTFRGLTYERSFLVSLIMIAPIVALVMMLIGSNLALSLGLVGALSIIRFRTVIKDSRDMVYLFWAIAIGLGGGTLNWTVAAVASLAIGAMLILLYYMDYGKSQSSDYILVVKGTDVDLAANVEQLLKDSQIQSAIRSLEASDAGFDLVLEIRSTETNSGRLRDLLSQMRALPSITHASILAPHLSLPI